MNDENEYLIGVTGTTSREVAVEVLDTRYSIKDILGAEGFPIDVWSSDESDWYGDITIDGSVVARYRVVDAEASEDIHWVIMPNGDQIDGEELESRLLG